MIFSLFGTSMLPFARLAEALDRLAGERGLDVLVQNGTTEYRFEHCRHKPFMPHDEVVKAIAECEYMICQGGAGSISDGLHAGKKIIAVPRLLELGETAASQLPLVDELARQGCILVAHDIKELGDLIGRLSAFTPARPAQNGIPQLIRDFLEKI